MAEAAHEGSIECPRYGIIFQYVIIGNKHQGNAKSDRGAWCKNMKYWSDYAPAETRVKWQAKNNNGKKEIDDIQTHETDDDGYGGGITI